VVLLLVPGVPRAATYYVRQTIGDDTHDGLSPQTAWQHFSKLSPAMHAGDVAYVGPGLYREEVVVENDGTAHILKELEPVYPNGIVAEPDGSIVWVESYTRRVVRRSPEGSVDVIHELADKHIPDGFKIDTDGNAVADLSAPFQN